MKSIKKNCLVYLNTTTGYISSVCALQTLHPYMDIDVTFVFHWWGPDGGQAGEELKKVISLFSRSMSFSNHVIWFPGSIMNREAGTDITTDVSEYLKANSAKSAYDEIYYAHDVNENLYPFLCTLYPRAKRICFGDGFGSLHERKARLSEIKIDADETAGNCKPHLAVPILPVDYYGNFIQEENLRICPKDVFLAVLEQLISQSVELREYINGLLDRFKIRRKYLLIAENYAEAKRIDPNKDSMMYCSVVHRYTLPGDVIFFKSHPGEVYPKVDKIKSYFKNDREIIELDKKFSRYPIELWKELITNSQPICMTIPVLTIKYIYDIDVIQPLTEEFLRYWFKERYWGRVRSTLHIYKQAVESLSTWQASGFLYSQTLKDTIEINKGILLCGENAQKLFYERIEPILKFSQIVIAGSGSHTRMLLEAYPLLAERVICISTIKKQEETVFGIPVTGEEDLKAIQYEAILISSRPYEKEILERLVAQGIPLDKIHTLYTDKERWLERVMIFREQREKRIFKKPVIAFFGHHKAATTWICDIFHRVARELELNTRNFWDTKLFDYHLRDFLLDHDTEVISYTNADYRYVREIENDVLGFHVVRDPRDICVSAYYSHLYSHPTDVWPELEEHRKQLQACSKDDGLLLEMEFRRGEFTEMLSWNYDNPNIFEIKMEELTLEPEKMFKEIFSFLQLLYLDDPRKGKISLASLEAILHENRFDKKSGGRQKGREDVKNHYRKGVAGDWRNHFEPVHMEFFKANYNDLLITLGYEETGYWE